MKHTSAEFERDLERLKDLLVLMGGMIESMLKEASTALLENDGVLALKVIDCDVQLDQLEKKVDEQAINILALRQPTATDLRFVCAAMKICTDLERMGDILVNVCERVDELSKHEPLKPYQDLPQMMSATGRMVTKAIDGFVNLSLELAEEVLKSDNEIDHYFKEIYGELLELMEKNPQAVDRGIRLISIAKSLERMADHATNIAEQIVFTVKGLDIRHSSTDQKVQSLRGSS